MAEDTEHPVVVRAWLGAAEHLPSELLIEAFEAGFAALWSRARQTLGDVTLTAIVDRVLTTLAERHPVVAALELDTAGINCKRLLESAAALQRDQVAQGLGLVFEEFLTVLGHLTAEILTPVLHAELSQLRHGPRRGRADEAVPAEAAEESDP